MRRLVLFFAMSIFALACEDDQGDQVLSEQTSETIVLKRSGANGRISSLSEIPCEQNIPISITYNGAEIGTGSIATDSENVSVLIDLTSGEWFLFDVSIFIGDCANIPPTSAFPYVDSYTTDDEKRLYERTISLANHPDCGCIRVVATVARFNTSSTTQSFTFSQTEQYCCEEPEEPDDKDLRTQTPGGWGAPPNGNNPGTYLHANFDDVFPNGLVVGCNYTITLTSAQAITDWMPNGGTAEALTKNYVDPNNINKDPNNPKNVLAMHIVALTLSVNFDLLDEDFGESNTNLINAVITTGTFQGWTVGEVLDEAEKVLGGCASNYSPTQMNEVISAINESYVDGNKKTNFLENGN